MKTATITAGEVMTGFVAAEPSDTLGEIAEKMREANAGSALVIDYGRLVGILTSRDIRRGGLSCRLPTTAPSSSGVLRVHGKETWPFRELPEEVPYGRLGERKLHDVRASPVEGLGTFA